MGGRTEAGTIGGPLADGQPITAGVTALTDPPEVGALLTVDRLSVTYGRTQALQGVSLSLPERGLVLVLGPNGAGKTTLVKGIAGAVPLRAGRVMLGARDVRWVAAHKRVRLGVALVPEGRGTLPGLSVMENLEIGWHAAAASRRGSCRSEIEQVMEHFPRLAERKTQDCSTLSGGEMQMLAIARALLSKPSVLLLDEPSLGLAPIVTAGVYAILTELNRQGLAIVLVEQKAVPLGRVPSTTIVLRTGRVVYQKDDARPTDAELAELYLGGSAL